MQHPSLNITSRHYMTNYDLEPVLCKLFQHYRTSRKILVLPALSDLNNLKVVVFRNPISRAQRYQGARSLGIFGAHARDHVKIFGRCGFVCVRVPETGVFFGLADGIDQRGQALNFHCRWCGSSDALEKRNSTYVPKCINRGPKHPMETQTNYIQTI